MPTEVIVALCSLVGTVAGSFLGVYQSSKLTIHRIAELEKKMDKHNGLIERMAVVERDQKTLFKYHDDHGDRIKTLEVKA